MKLVKSLLLGSAAGLMTVAAAQAADLPTRKAAPVEYVRVCDAYGAGFFYIPGTDTCLRVGGLVLAQMGIQPSSQLYSVGLNPGTAVGGFAAFPGVVGTLPATTGYTPVRGREIFGYTATGRLELDSRTQTPFGTVRTFARIQSNYGSSANYTTGSLASSLGFNAFNNTAGPTVSRELTYLDKAFIQFAGITAGRVQSFFDFYADAINYTGLHGPNNTTWAAAYTFTAGGGLSLTAAIEDAASHRGPVGSVLSLGTSVGALVPNGSHGYRRCGAGRRGTPPQHCRQHPLGSALGCVPAFWRCEPDPGKPVPLDGGDSRRDRKPDGLRELGWDDDPDRLCGQCWRAVQHGYARAG